MGVGRIVGAIWLFICSMVSKSTKLGFAVTKWSIVEFIRAVATYVLIMKVMKVYPPPCDAEIL